MEYSFGFNSDQQEEIRKVKDRGTLMNGDRSIPREVSKTSEKNVSSVNQSVSPSPSIHPAVSYRAPGPML